MKILRMYGWNKLVGTNLTTDNLYTSIELANELLAKHMTLLGTMRKNRKGLPKELVSCTNREELSSEVWFESSQGKISLISYVVETKSRGMKNVIVLCTIPNLPTIGVTKDDGKKKPGSIKVYDFSKVSLDLSFTIISTYYFRGAQTSWTKGWGPTHVPPKKIAGHPKCLDMSLTPQELTRSQFTV